MGYAPDPDKSPTARISSGPWHFGILKTPDNRDLFMGLFWNHSIRFRNQVLEFFIKYKLKMNTFQIINILLSWSWFLVKMNISFWILHFAQVNLICNPKTILKQIHRAVYLPSGISTASHKHMPVAYPGFWFGGTLLGVGLVGVRGERSPPDAGEFSKIFKKFPRKIAKKALF